MERKKIPFSFNFILGFNNHSVGVEIFPEASKNSLAFPNKGLKYIRSHFWWVYEFEVNDMSGRCFQQRLLLTGDSTLRQIWDLGKHERYLLAAKGGCPSRINGTAEMRTDFSLVPGRLSFMCFSCFQLEASGNCYIFQIFSFCLFIYFLTTTKPFNCV